MNTRKILIVYFVLNLAYVGAAYAQKPEKILGIAQENKSTDYYRTQSSLWQRLLQKNPQDRQAWINYYRAERAILQLERPDLWPGQRAAVFKLLTPIVQKAESSIPSTFEYYLLKGMNSDEPESSSAFIKAYELDPERDEIYGKLLVHYVFSSEEEALIEISKRMIEANIYSNSNMMWNYNALQSIDKNGLIVTNGDMDSMPKWVLQYGLGIRQDVLVANRWMLAYSDEYRKSIFSKANLTDPNKNRADFKTTADYVDYLTKEILTKTSRPVYMSTGTGIDFFRKYQLDDYMYVVGNAIKYSEADFNNTRVIRENFENKFYMEYLLQNFQSHPQDEVVKTRMNLTYLPGLIHMRDHYTKTNNSKIEWYAKYIDRITTDSGRKEEVLSWFE